MRKRIQLFTWNMWMGVLFSGFSFTGLAAGQGVQIAVAENFNQARAEARELLHYSPTEVDEKNRTALNKIISIDLADVPMEEALRQIAEVGGLRLAYSTSIGKEYWRKPVSIRFDRATVLGALYAALEGTDLKLTLSTTSGNGQIVVEKDPDAEFEVLVPVAGFQEQVTGRVTDAQTGEILPGVNIGIKGTSRGTTTDVDGIFELAVSSLQDTLVVSFIGYNTLEVPVNLRTELGIELASQVVVGEEIVVTAVGTRRFRDQDGSASSHVGTEEIMRSRETGLINSLAGKASGVRIGKSNGDPGAGAVIQIRGANTIQGASQPLIILDGVPVSNDNIGSGNFSQQSRLNDINPNDVESVQVLKGASAAALWGSRAANGVIVITTKSGAAAQRPSVQYSVTQSFDHINVRTPMQGQFGQGRGGEWNVNFAESWGDKIADRSGGADDVDQTEGYFISDISGERYYPVISKNSRETFVDSNYDLVFQTGTYTEHDLSVSGGGDRASYFFSIGNLNQEGIIRNYTYDRQNLRLNNRVQLTDWLSWDNKITYTGSKSNRIHQAGNTTNGIMLGLLRTPPDFDMSDYIGTYVSASGDVFPGRQRSYRVQLGHTGNPVYNNPMWTLYEQGGENEVKRFIITPQLQIDPLDWLNVIVRGGIDYYNDSREEFYPVGSASGLRAGGLWEQFEITSRELNFDAMANIDRALTQHISLTATLGANLNDRERTSNINTISPFAVNARLPSDDLNPDQAASDWNRNLMRIRSSRGYGILAFNFYDQLFVNVTGTMEAASTINGSFFYPSFDLAWQFSDLISSDILSFGKLRASWGKVGIQPAPYRFSTLASTGFSTFGGSYLVDNVRGNSDLKPEIKTEWEIGTDVRLFRNRVELGATYYQNRTTDILFAVRTTPSTGYSFNYTNAATTENKGVELDLRTRIVQARDLQISFNSNFNNNRNLVVDISGAETVDIGGTSRAVQGHAMSAFYLPGTLRDENGDLILDANGFPQLDTNARVIGNPNPKWRGGIGMDFDWKGFDFSFLFEHSHGGDFINRTRIVLYGFGVHEDVGHEVTLTEDLMNVDGQVFPAGTTVRGNIEDFGGGNVLLDEAWYRGIGGGLGFNKVNDLYVEDATWTKLRHITLGYTFSNINVFKGVNIQSLRFSVTGRDLFLWSGLNGVDPETNNYGVSNAFGMNYFNNPGTRSVTFNLQVNL